MLIRIMAFCSLLLNRSFVFQADDIIATYTRVAQESGHKVTIISPDKDFGQLVRTTILFGISGSF